MIPLRDNYCDDKILKDPSCHSSQGTLDLLAHTVSFRTFKLLQWDVDKNNRTMRINTSRYAMDQKVNHRSVPEIERD